MTTVTNTTVISNAGTTQFRAWGLEFSNALTAIGFIKSADTGQINWASVSRPGAIDTSAGYEIRYLNDSMHGSAPIYVKIEYGTGGATTTPGMWITIGTGSNGSGTITGTIVAREQTLGSAHALDSTALTKPSYYCMVDGCVWWVHKTRNRAGNTTPVHCFYLERTRDSAGVATAEGFAYYRGMFGWTFSYSASVVVYNFSTGYTYDFNTPNTIYGGGCYTFVPSPLVASGSIVGGTPGDHQVSRHYLAMPLIKALGTVVSSVDADGITEGTTFTATPLGVTARTFICMTKYAFSSTDAFCPVWE